MSRRRHKALAKIEKGVMPNMALIMYPTVPIAIICILHLRCASQLMQILWRLGFLQTVEGLPQVIPMYLAGRSWKLKTFSKIFNFWTNIRHRWDSGYPCWFTGTKQTVSFIPVYRTYRFRYNWTGEEFSRSLWNTPYVDRCTCLAYKKDRVVPIRIHSIDNLNPIYPSNWKLDWRSWSFEHSKLHQHTFAVT